MNVLRLISLAFVSVFGLSLCFGPSGLAADVAPDLGTPFDLQGFVDDALARGEQRIVIPPGRHRVTPRDGHHLRLVNVAGVELIAEGAELVCTETTRALTFERCRDVTLRGLVIDYDPLPYTQGSITTLSADRRIVDITLFDGYPPAATSQFFKYEIFDAATRELKTPDYYGLALEVTGERTLRLTKPPDGTDNGEAPGDLIVIASTHAPGGDHPHAVMLDHCSGVTLEDVTLWSSNCFGFFDRHSDRTTYRRCRIDRRPPADDPVVRASCRLRSLNADAFHSKHAATGPQIIGCTAFYMGDDAVNICGDYHLVTEGSGARYRVLARDAFFTEGERLELFTHEGIRLPDTRVVRIESEGEITARERAWLADQPMDHRLRTAWSPRAYRITLEHEVALTPFSVIASTSRMGNGFRVVDSRFGHNCSRGLLIKASQGEITGNTVKHTQGHAIYLAPEYWWLESGNASDVRITRNTITGSQGIPIAILAMSPDGRRAAAGAHRNLTITGNTVRESVEPALLATSTAGLHLADNHLGPPSGSLPDWQQRDLGIHDHPHASVVLLDCTDVSNEATHLSISR